MLVTIGILTCHRPCPQCTDGTGASCCGGEPATSLVLAVDTPQPSRACTPFQMWDIQPQGFCAVESNATAALHDMIVGSRLRQCSHQTGLVAWVQGAPGRTLQSERWTNLFRHTQTHTRARAHTRTRRHAHTPRSVGLRIISHAEDNNDGCSSQWSHRGRVGHVVACPACSPGCRRSRRAPALSAPRPCVAPLPRGYPSRSRREFWPWRATPSGTQRTCSHLAQEILEC